MAEAATPPCVLGQNLDNLNNAHNLHVDDVALYEIPDTLVLRDTVCADFGTTVDLLEIMPPPFDGRTDFRWEDGSTAPARSLPQPGVYHVRATLNCAETTVELMLENGNCTGEILAPNAFTPNADGRNDGWSVLVRTEFPIVNYQLRLYDRSGKMVWSTDDPAAVWDGGNLPVGVYVWRAEWAVRAQGETVPLRDGGVVTVVR